MTLNTPCVVCRSAGSSEFVIDGVNAIMTEPNPISLYNGVLKMIKSKDRHSFAVEARKMVENRFSSQCIIKLLDRQIATYEIK